MLQVIPFFNLYDINSNVKTTNKNWCKIPSTNFSIKGVRHVFCQENFFGLREICFNITIFFSAWLMTLQQSLQIQI